MTSVLEPVGTVRVCVSCGESFTDPSRTSPRSYCDECRDRSKGKGVVPPAGRFAGEPFTVGHFRAWAEQKELPDGPFELQSFQEDFVGDVFRLRGTPAEALLVVPEGNGKSSLIALLALYFLEFTQEATIPVAAATRDQAFNVLFACMVGIVRRNNLHQFSVHPGLRQIRCALTDGLIQVYAAEAGGADGVQPRGLMLLDELHRLKSLGPGSLYLTWVGKLEKANALLVGISTAGAPQSEFEELRKQFRETGEAEQVGCFLRAISERSVLHEYALPDGADPENLELVAAANPLEQITVETLRAKRAAPSWNLAHWRRFTCNMPTQESDAAITTAEWNAALSEEQIPEGADVWLGIDFGFKWDTTAIVPLWWRDDEFRLFGDVTIFEPPMDSSSLHPGLIKAALRDYLAKFKVSTVVMDMSDAEDIAHWISDELDLLVVDRAQTATPQHEDYDRFMAALRNGQLKHTGDKGLRAHVFNAITVMTDLGSPRFGRSSPSRAASKQARRVIDALVAAAMVHSVRVDPPKRQAGRAWGFS